MLLAIALLLERRLDLALAASAIGCWSVPSLPIVLSGLLFIVIVLHWQLESDRSPMRLLRTVIPGVATWGLLGLILTAIFGWQSVAATALPLEGAQFYRTQDFGLFTSLSIFLFPGTAWPSHFNYYVGQPAVWWAVSSLVLFVLGLLAALHSVRRRAINTLDSAVVLCALLHLAFILVAYGTPGQHRVYDFVLVAGVVIGLAALPARRLRNVLAGGFVVLALVSHLHQARMTWALWHETKLSAATAYFYAYPSLAKDWSRIVELSKTHGLFLLSYATGVHHYFPSVQSAHGWTIQSGQLLPADKQRLLASIDGADIVVLDLSGPATLFDGDEAI